MLMNTRYNECMRVFSTFDNRPATVEKGQNKRRKGSGPKKSKKSYRPPRENLSAEQIKARVAKETAPKAKKVDVNKGKQVSTFMSDETKISRKAINLQSQNKVKPTKEEVKVSVQKKVVATSTPKKEEKAEAKSETKDIMLQSDVKLNDPTDPNTRKKLKGLLTTGGFGWNEKERAALADILGKD
jgi:hypothetical protein